MSTRLVLDGITKHYVAGKNAVTAVQDVSFSLAEGEFLAIQGPSGSGKSSLLNICGLIDAPSQGQYYLNGNEVGRLNIAQRCEYRRRDIGFIFQHHQLLPAMTVYENVAYPLYLNKVAPKKIKLEVTQLLEKTGLSHRCHHLPTQLSGGERQRVGIVRALIKRPQLVIADEPSANLDHKHAHSSLMLMRELNEQHGASFIIASHDVFVIEHCDSTVNMLDGCRVSSS